MAPFVSRTFVLSIHLVVLGISFSPLASAQSYSGETPALGENRITQEDVAGGRFSLSELQLKGRTIFSTPFNKLDGYGDGPVNVSDPIAPGGRPTLQNNGSLLRVNGLDAQTCLECHFIVSHASIPFEFGVGGAGGSITNAIFQPTFIDPLMAGKNNFTGRFINPPSLFGAGGLELLAKEMTADLQALKAQAKQHPGTTVALVTKGVHFGSIRYANGAFHTSGVEGLDADLVVRPFGRKGEFATAREFDGVALAFHFGMQAVELFGKDVDADGDGITNEILAGELSALSIFVTTLPPPTSKDPGGNATVGKELFRSIGCADCHIPSLPTNSRSLTYSFPEIFTSPAANVFFAVNLSAPPTHFKPTAARGLTVPLFADLKRHAMGSDLCESLGSPLDCQFTTARLWGVADTAPYLHDGRALTLTDAILLHGGEAEAARHAFTGLTDEEKVAILTFLRTLRNPLTKGNKGDKDTD